MSTSNVTESGSRRIATAFDGARDGGPRAALMPFLMGGFPSLEGSARIAAAYADGGADLVELGIPSLEAPFDGPVIRAAGRTALCAGATVDAIFDIARTMSQRLPVLVMSYASVVVAHGAQRFAGDLQAAGVSGLIVPDLPSQVAPALLDACDAAGIALVPVISPTTNDGDVARIAARARGFVYVVSRRGRTGARTPPSAEAPRLIERVRAHSTVPVALGFGISTPAHVAQARSAGADGVIVGSRLVRAAAQACDPPAAVREVLAELRPALQSSAPRQRHRLSPLPSIARRAVHHTASSAAAGDGACAV